MKLPLNLKFADMSDNQRRAVLAWARSHDWGGKPAEWRDMNGVLMLLVSGAVCDRENVWSTEKYLATTLKELRDWAGY